MTVGAAERLSNPKDLLTASEFELLMPLDDGICGNVSYSSSCIREAEILRLRKEKEALNQWARGLCDSTCLEDGHKATWSLEIDKAAGLTSCYSGQDVCPSISAPPPERGPQQSFLDAPLSSLGALISSLGAPALDDEAGNKTFRVSSLLNHNELTAPEFQISSIGHHLSRIGKYLSSPSIQFKHPDSRIPSLGAGLADIGATISNFIPKWKNRDSTLATLGIQIANIGRELSLQGPETSGLEELASNIGAQLSSIGVRLSDTETNFPANKSNLTNIGEQLLGIISQLSNNEVSPKEKKGYYSTGDRAKPFLNVHSQGGLNKGNCAIWRFPSGPDDFGCGLPHEQSSYLADTTGVLPQLWKDSKIGISTGYQDSIEKREVLKHFSKQNLMLLSRLEELQEQNKSFRDRSASMQKDFEEIKGQKISLCEKLQDSQQAQQDIKSESLILEGKLRAVEKNNEQLAKQSIEVDRARKDLKKRVAELENHLAVQQEAEKLSREELKETEAILERNIIETAKITEEKLLCCAKVSELENKVMENNQKLKNLVEVIRNYVDLTPEDASQPVSTESKMMQIPEEDLVKKRLEEYFEKIKLGKQENNEKTSEDYKQEYEKRVTSLQNELSEAKKHEGEAIKLAEQKRSVVEKLKGMRQKFRGNFREAFADIVKELQHGAIFYKVNYHSGLRSKTPARRFVMLTKDLKVQWTKDLKGKTGWKPNKFFLVKDITRIDYGVHTRSYQRLKHHPKLFPWQCFCICTSKRTYDYAAFSNTAESWVYGLGRLALPFVPYLNVRSRQQIIQERTRMKLDLYCEKQAISPAMMWKKAIGKALENKIDSFKALPEVEELEIEPPTPLSSAISRKFTRFKTNFNAPKEVTK